MEEKTDLRIIKTHKALYEAFIDLCSEKKFEDITVGELCDRALVRRATFYKHFADKYDFFSFFVRYYQDKFSKAFEEQSKKAFVDSTPKAFYTFLFNQFLSFINMHLDLVNSLSTSSAFPTLLNLLCDEIRRVFHLHLLEQKADGFAPSINPDILSAFFAGGIMQIIRYWITNQETVSQEYLSESFSGLIEISGLG